jgi:hypothetical protein
MMNRTKLKKIALNNFTLALLFSLPFFFALQWFISPFRVDITGPMALQELYKYLVYNDLDGNGESDIIYFGENQLGNVYAKVFDPAHRGQFNSSGKFTSGYFIPFFADTDGDGYNEILFITQNDSVKAFLNIVNYQKETLVAYEIGEVGMPGKRDFEAEITHFIDLDNDGIKEVVFNVNAGYALQPRAIYVFYPKTGAIIRTPMIGTKLNRYFIADINNDGYCEIVCGTFTWQNYPDTTSVPFDDNRSRLFIFDHHLQFKAPPIEFSAIRSHARCFPLKNEDTINIFLFVDHQGDLNTPNELYLVNPRGGILKKMLLDQSFAAHDNRHQVLEAGQELMLYSLDGEFYRISPEMELVKSEKLSRYVGHHIRSIDLNSDGETEFLFYNQLSGNITVTDNRFRHPVTSSAQVGSMRLVSPFISKSTANGYLLRNNIGHYMLNYGANQLWGYRFFIYAAIYVFFTVLLFIVNRIQSYKINEKLRGERELQELQYRVITAQFSPHYTFNVLNTISSQLYDEKRPELHDYFTRFIRQLRYLYDDRNAITRSLKDEIDFCRDYLDIQKMRFPDKFEYEIEVEYGVDPGIQIPKMMLHIFVENAFKHGLRPYTSGGLMQIDLKRENQRTIITITDNGIGREAARAYIRENPHYSSGRGLQMLREFIDLYNKDKKEKVEMLIEDLEEDGKVVGMRVVIKLESR